MATAERTPSVTGTRLTASRKSAFVMGALYIATFVTSIAAALLYSPMLSDAHYVLGGGPDTRLVADDTTPTEPFTPTPAAVWKTADPSELRAAHPSGRAGGVSVSNDTTGHAAAAGFSRASRG